VGTAPVRTYRRLIHGLVAAVANGSLSPDVNLIVVTPDPDGSGIRPKVWRQLITDSSERSGASIPSTVRSWTQLSAFAPRLRDLAKYVESNPAARTRQVDKLFALVSRHPYLTRDQLEVL